MCKLAAEAAATATLVHADEMRSWAWSIFANTLEAEVASEHVTNLRISGQLGTPVQARWEPVTCPHTQASDKEQVSDGWKWLQTTLHTLINSLQQGESASVESELDDLAGLGMPQLFGAGSN